MLTKDEDFNTQDSSTRRQTDADLREAGFHIHSRPDQGEAIWERDNRRYRQSEAVRLLPKTSSSEVTTNTTSSSY